jgi:hypothetical protein
VHLSEPQTIQILSIAFLWVMFLSAVRFSASAAYSLRPLVAAAGRIARRRSSRGLKGEVLFALDTIQERYSEALCTPWAIPLLFGGMVALGIGVSLLSSGDVMILVARYPQWWVNDNRYLDWAGSMLGGLGMAACLAAVARRRTASFLISSGFAITGLGIGIIAAIYV